MHPFTVTIKGEVTFRVIVPGFIESEIYEMMPEELIEGNLLSTDYDNLIMVDVKAR